MAALETILTDLGPVIQGNNVLLFVVLILLFVVGYKLLQTAIRLGLVAIMSGVFLVVLDMMGIGPAVTVQRFILFMVLGTGLFILYSTLSTAVWIIDLVYSVLSRTFNWAFRSQKKPYKESTVKKVWKTLKHSRNKDTSVSEQRTKEKEIVLGELDDE